MIAIIDYGMGNLRSVQKAFECVGHQARVTRDPKAINEASHVVLPGVGAFPDCMANLERYALVEPIHRAIVSGKPFLGICLGLQLLFTESEEFGVHKGLDVIPGRVRRFPWGQTEPVPVTTGTDPTRPSRASGSSDGPGEGGQSPLKVPHMGWNTVSIVRPAPPMHGLDSGTHFYFVHSYYVEPSDPSVVATRTDYGVSFASSIWRDNVFASQFHPEKSQSAGLAIIRNFGAWR